MPSSSIARYEKSTLVIVDGGTCRRRALERFDVPQPIYRIDGEHELNEASRESIVSRGGTKIEETS